MNVNGATIDIAVNDNNGYTANFYLTGGTMSATGGGTFHFANGYGVTTYSSTATSLISSDIVTRDKGTMNFDVARGTTASGVDLLVSGNIIPLTFVGGVEGINKAGSGVMVLSGNNSYDGGTTINGGVLQAIDGVGLPSGSSFFNGGVLQSSGTFSRTVGNGDTNGTAVAADSRPTAASLTVYLGSGANDPLVWNNNTRGGGTGGFLNDGETLIFGSPTANSQVVFQNNIDLNGEDRTIRVDAGTGGDSALFSGTIQNTAVGSPAGLIKTGAGTLILSGTNSYDGSTTVERRHTGSDD